MTNIKIDLIMTADMVITNMGIETTATNYVIVLSKRYSNPYRVYTKTTRVVTDGVNTSREHETYYFCRGYKLLKTAQCKYPDAEYIAEEIVVPHGGSFNVVKSTRYLNNNVFPYGKYKGELISASEDLDYLNWFVSTLTEKHTMPMKVNVDLRIRQLEANNPAFNTLRAKQVIAIRKLAVGNPEFVCDTNIKISYDGIQIGAHTTIDDIDVYLEFDKYATYYYAGFPYGLPLDKKEKSKRIKGKPIILKDFKYEFIANGNVLIKVSDWELKKK